MGQLTPMILVVDDEAEIQRTLADVLEDEGYRVVLADNGRDALSLIGRDGAPDMILLDLMMPVMDGWSFLAALRADAALAGVPVVVLTAVVSHAPAPCWPVKEVMGKPVRIETLLAAVSRCTA